MRNPSKAQSRRGIGLLLWCGLALVAAMLPARGQGHYTGSGVAVRSLDGTGLDLPATLLRPDGDGPFPAIVMLHDCSGLGRRSSGAPGRWGSLLAGLGYVVLIPDSFLPRGFPDGVCIITPGPAVKVMPFQRTFDAYGALALLRTLPFVDAAHVGVMGGSHGGSTTLATIARAERLDLDAMRANGFAAAVALYPGCGARYGGRWRVTRQGGLVGPVIRYDGTYQPLAPLLILIGEADDWTPAADCRVLAERAADAGYPVTLKIYPGAVHSFDSPNPTRFDDQRNNPNRLDGRGATTGGDKAAWDDAIKQVTAFFAAHLKPAR
jgi:dienelactone hydrolase